MEKAKLTIPANYDSLRDRIEDTKEIYGVTLTPNPDGSFFAEGTIENLQTWLDDITLGDEESQDTIWIESGY